MTSINTTFMSMTLIEVSVSGVLWAALQPVPDWGGGGQGAGGGGEPGHQGHHEGHPQRGAQQAVLQRHVITQSFIIIADIIKLMVQFIDLSIIVKPWPQTQKPKTKGPWADTKIL